MENIGIVRFWENINPESQRDQDQKLEKSTDKWLQLLPYASMMQFGPRDFGSVFWHMEIEAFVIW
jgi:hypothetical protein